MSDVLVRIKRAVLSGRYVFSEKARLEMETDALTQLDVAESILNADDIYKKLRSRSRWRRGREYLYVIQSANLDGLLIYSQWYDRPQSLFLRVRVTLVPFQPHRFMVRLSSTFCPIELGTSNDIRKLGMTISELSLG